MKQENLRRWLGFFIRIFVIKMCGIFCKWSRNLSVGINKISEAHECDVSEYGFKVNPFEWDWLFFLESSFVILIFSLQHIQALLSNRGPNKSGQHSIATTNYNILFRGHVLWQQGSQPCNQPLVHGDHILLMNGDIYTDRTNQEISDTEFLMNQILKCKVDFISFRMCIVRLVFVLWIICRTRKISWNFLLPL